MQHMQDESNDDTNILSDDEHFPSDLLSDEMKLTKLTPLYYILHSGRRH